MVGTYTATRCFYIAHQVSSWQYILIGDIKKMYRQVLIHEKQRSLQKILWRANKEYDVQIFKLKTVTYGTACVPYLVVRALQEITRDYS